MFLKDQIRPLVAALRKSLVATERERLAAGRFRVAFVVPWFGKGLGGGAEAACLGLVEACKEYCPEIDVEVFTTALKEFAVDWNQNVHTEGLHDEHGIKVRRFIADPSDRTKFGPMNEFRLVPKVVDDLWVKGKRISPLTPEEEEQYQDYMVHSKSMYEFMDKNYFHYDYFFFIPYMFGPSFRGSKAVLGKAVIFPCLHDERYAYMDLYASMMRKAVGSLYNVAAEMRLSQRIYKIKHHRAEVLGVMVDCTPVSGDGARFRQKYQIPGQYLLYAGRKIAGKNLNKLVDLFVSAQKQGLIAKDLRLVLIGKGDLVFDAVRNPGVMDLGYVSLQDKMDAYQGTAVLCQLSLNESFSIVMMEAWLQGTPCIVDTECEVTREHCENSEGGFAISNLEQFAKAVNALSDNPAQRKQMGAKGRQYVLDNYQPEIVAKKFRNYLNTMSGNRRAQATAN